MDMIDKSKNSQKGDQQDTHEDVVGEKITRQTDAMSSEDKNTTKNTKKRRWRGAEAPYAQQERIGGMSGAITQSELHDRRKVLDHVYGEQGVASVELGNLCVPIRFADVNKLVLWVLTSTGSSPSWAQVKNIPLVEKFLIIYACGIDRALWAAKKEHMPNLLNLFGAPLTTVANSPVQTPLKGAGELLSVTMTKKEQKAAKSHMLKKRKISTGPSPGPSHYVLNELEMQKYDFPMHVLDENGEKKCPPGYLETMAPGEGGNHLDMVAFDCEMCETAEGQELTRMTLLTKDGEVVVDVLVKPENPITNYLTEFSGITPKMMEKATKRLRDAQDLFLGCVSSQTFLVGHGLENDLRAVKVLHRKVLDTVVMYPHPRGYPSRSALKVLCEKFLHRKIQTGAHDSVADARAAMDLVMLKLKRGMEYQIVSSPDFAEGDTARGFVQSVKLVELLHKENVRCCLVDRKHILSLHSFSATDVVPVESDADAEAAVMKRMQESCPAKFVWTQLQELGRFYFQRSKYLQGLLKIEPDFTPNFTEERHLEIIEEVDKRIGTIYEKCSKNTVLMVVTGQGDTMDALTKQEAMMKRQQGIGPAWTREDEQSWNILSQKIIQGLCFVTVKDRA